MSVVFYFMTQSTVETSVFIIDFVAMKQGINAMGGLTYIG